MKDISDAVAPAKVVRKILEEDVQEQCINWARARGYWARKFSSISQRSVPDYLFSRSLIGTYTTKFACEFKAPGKTSTKQQIDEQEAMRLAGWYVFECDNFSKFKAVVINYEKESP